MGTLKHLLAHIDREDEEPIDPRSVCRLVSCSPLFIADAALMRSSSQNLLYFPLPVTTSTTPARLPRASIYISQHYPEEYRRYLAGLAEALDQRQCVLSVLWPFLPSLSSLLVSFVRQPLDPTLRYFETRRIVITPSIKVAEEYVLDRTGQRHTLRDNAKTHHLVGRISNPMLLARSARACSPRCVLHPDGLHPHAN
jgi:hypothetical protein